MRNILRYSHSHTLKNEIADVQTTSAANATNDAGAIRQIDFIVSEDLYTLAQAISTKACSECFIIDYPHQLAPVWHFTSRQQMSSGVTTSAGRAKNLWERAEKVWVGMGVAWGMGGGKFS